ncbi:hypothetical protein, partial [Ardenticatena maritima]
FDEYSPLLRRIARVVNGDADAFQSVLAQWGALGEDGRVIAADVTHDTKPELIANYVNPSNPEERTLLVLSRRNDAYHILLDTFAQGEPTAHLLDARDINNDHLAELAYTTRQCTRLVCITSVHIERWNGRTFASLLTRPIDIAYAHRVALVAWDTDPALELLLESEDAPDRLEHPRREIWDWNGSTYVLRTTMPVESNWLALAAFDGYAALQQGEWERAERLLLRVLNDNTLRLWHGAFDTTYDATTERQLLRAFAGFHLVVLYTAQQRPFSVQHMLERLQREAPSHPLTRAASIFRETWAQTGSTASACIAVETMLAREGAIVLQQLNDFGYNVPTFTVENICLPLTSNP